MQAPGADDDASGSATILEVFRTMMKNRFEPDRTVEFHAYAAEEVHPACQSISMYQRINGPFHHHYDHF